MEINSNVQALEVLISFLLKFCFVVVGVITYNYIIDKNLKIVRDLPCSEKTVREIKIRMTLYRYRNIIILLYGIFFFHHWF